MFLVVYWVSSKLSGSLLKTVFKRVPKTQIVNFEVLNVEINNFAGVEFWHPSCKK
jgi:hypothetical protein